MIEKRSLTRQEYEAEIDQIFAEFLRSKDNSKHYVIGATYLRHSTKFQDSVSAQLRSNLGFALANGIYIPREHIFFDAAVSGGKSHREGLASLNQLIDQGVVKVIVMFTSNRLFRRAKYMHDFVDLCKAKKIRLIFHKNGIDTLTDKSGIMTGIHAVLDEAGRVANIEAIKTAHKDLHRQKIVTTSLPYGFVGKPIPNGPLTRRGRPRCAIAIEAFQADVLLQIFQRRAAGASRQEILHWLNYETNYRRTEDPNLLWTDSVLARILKNRRYLGEFEYHDHDAQGTECDTVFRDPDLQIIPDELFTICQLQKHKPHAGRKGNPSTAKIPKILNGRVYCPVHKVALQCNGMSGGVMQCAKCKTLRAKDRALYSYLSRYYGTEVLLKGIADGILQAKELVPEFIQSCKSAAEAAQQIDPKRRAKLQEEIAVLAQSIKATYRNPGKNPEQVRFIDQQREGYLKEQAELQKELAVLVHSASADKQIPSSSVVIGLLKKLHEIFNGVAQSQKPQQVAEINRLIDLLTGGKIVLKQCGERIKRRGWLEGTCPFHLKKYLLNELGFATTAELVSTTLHFNFRLPEEKYRNPPKSVADTQQIYDLYVNGRTEEEIRKELGHSRSTVTRHLDKAFLQLGIARPTKKERRKQLSQRADKQPKYKLIAASVLNMIEEGVDRVQIAKRHHMTWTTLKQVYNYLRSQGNAVPDGRFSTSGRKPYKSNSIQGAEHVQEAQEPQDSFENPGE
jgi:DNA invertase Pin-like site-specific DNA recombinase